jgi:hypothetical protein
MDKQKVEYARKLCGVLKKKSPSLIKGYQKRYFMILKEKLVWFKNENQTSDIKGSLIIAEITSVVPNGAKDFEINYSGRKFELRADTTDLRDEWVRSLKTLVEHLKIEEAEIKEK